MSLPPPKIDLYGLEGVGVGLPRVSPGDPTETVDLGSSWRERRSDSSQEEVW